MSKLRATVDGRIDDSEVFLRLPNSSELACCFQNNEISFSNDATHDLVVVELRRSALAGEYIIKIKNTEDVERSFRYKIFFQKKLPEVLNYIVSLKSLSKIVSIFSRLYLIFKYIQKISHRHIRTADIQERSSPRVRLD